MEINVEFEGVERAMRKLARLSNSALPIAARNTLNELAFNTKARIPETASKKFVTRNKTLFKSHTGVKKASGRQMATLKSAVGLLANKKISDNLAEQERGGTIKGRGFIQTKFARIGKNNARKVQRANLLTNVKFKDKFFMMKNKRGKTFVYKKTGKRKITPIYSYKKGRSVRAKKNEYIKESAEKELKKTGEIFLKMARKQIRYELER